MGEAVAYRLGYPVDVASAAYEGELIIIALVERTRLAVVETCHALKLKLLGSVAEVIAGEVGKAHLGGECVTHAHRCLRHTLALDDDDTVGGVLAIEGGSGSVLQDVDTLDVLDVHVVESLKIALHAIDHDEW